MIHRAPLFLRRLSTPALALLVSCEAAPSCEPGGIVADRTALEALRGVEVICGDLVITNLEGPDIEPLSALLLVEGSLHIQQNLELQDLGGLDGLQQVGLHVSVFENPALIEASLPSLEAVTGDVVIAGNPALQTVNAERLRWIGQDLVIADNTTLPVLDGFHGLRELGSDMRLGDLDAITEIHLPDRLVSVSNIVISDNPALLRVGGGAALVHIDELLLENNTALTELAGLPAVEEGITINGHDNPLIETLGQWSRLRRGSLILDHSAPPQICCFPQWRNSSLFLFLSNNPALESLGDVHGLETMGLVWIYLNPKLAPGEVEAALADSEHGAVKVGGNAGEPVPYDPCPWAGDGFCDEATGTGLCLDDPDDCG